MYKKVLTAAVAAGIMTGSMPVMAEFSANVAMTSNYVWRGVSQSDEDAAIQGGFDYSHKTGLYAGVWGSNVDFDEAVVDPADMELDLYAGYSTDIGDVGLDVGVIQYRYQDSTADLDWTEFYASGSYKFLSASINHSSDVFNSSDDGTYINVGAEHEFSGYTLGASIGNYSLDNGFNDYTDYKLSVASQVQGVDLELSFTDTDLSDSECQTDYATTKWCEGSFNFTLSKSF